MRRRLSALALGLLASIAFVSPVLADTTPDPGNFRDSGSASYFSAFSSECGTATCTDTNVFAQVVELQSGETFSDLCVDVFTYNIRGGRGSGVGGCVQATADIADDLSSASFSGTVLLESCNRRTCSGSEVDVSLTLNAVGAANAYSRTEKNQFENCTDTYRVRGSNRQAEGSITVDGATSEAFGQIGAETFTFTTRCR
jgi:hypothetical protein